MSVNIPPTVPNAFRIALVVDFSERIDKVLLQALRDQNENPALKEISRGALKDLFSNGKILIKGQRARSSSSLAKGTTYVDILPKNL